MFGPPGRAYVYFIYGMHTCLNVVTEADDRPAAVLIRAVAGVEGLAGPARGPGLVCRALEIDRSFNGADLTLPPLYFVESELPLTDERVAVGPRVGIDYAGSWAELPWRFWIADSPAVSRPSRSRTRVPRRAVGG